VNTHDDDGPAATSARLKRDVLVMALIGVGHGTSHFFQLVVPALFLFLIADFDVSYTQLGSLMTTFFLVSGVGQPLAGFLVDRFGARSVLLLGLGIYCAAVFALALVPVFWAMFPLMCLAAIGNCVFHPADFTVLNASVRPGFLGRAFGVHTLGGNLGWALAPISMLLLAEVVGWRGALMGAAALGAAVWLMLWRYRHLLADDVSEEAATGDGAGTGALVLLQPAIVLCFTYFALLAAALIALQNFLPAILGALYETPRALAGITLTVFLVGAAAGVLGGGFLADRATQHSSIVAAGMAGSALLILSVAQIDYGTALLVAIVGGAGFLSGITTPSRDLLVRSATPPGATGRVFGVVYSGLDVGSALAPLTVGLMLDHDHPQWALWAVAAFMLLGVATVVSLPGRRNTATRVA
jgi:MFS transporter, FSR family, fosmidomycin resistance protein